MRPHEVVASCGEATRRRLLHMSHWDGTFVLVWPGPRILAHPKWFMVVYGGFILLEICYEGILDMLYYDCYLCDDWRRLELQKKKPVTLICYMKTICNFLPLLFATGSVFRFLLHGRLLVFFRCFLFRAYRLDQFQTLLCRSCSAEDPKAFGRTQCWLSKGILLVWQGTAVCPAPNTSGCLWEIWEIKRLSGVCIRFCYGAVLF